MAEERFIDTGGNRIHAVVHGEGNGPWVTLVHALATNARLWDDEAKAFTPEFRVVQIDLRGHGKSEAKVQSKTLDDFGSDIVAVWNALGIDKSHVVGLSVGGMIGFGLALNHPDRLLKLVAADCRADAPEMFVNNWINRRAILKEKGMAGVADMTLATWFAKKTRAEKQHVIDAARAMILETSDAGYVGASTAIQTLDYKRRLNEIRVPTLLVVGAEDGPHPAEMREMAKLMPGVDLAEIEDAGHLANLEQPERFDDIVLSFLRQ